MSKSTPTFSVIVPVYNVEAYVAECLDSLLAQTYGDFELIAIDDGSTDGSASVLERYAAQDARIRTIRQANGGLSTARNAGVEAAEGRFCLFVDSDDVVHPQLLEICHHVLQTQGADFVSYNYARIEPHAGGPAQRFELSTLRCHVTHNPYRLLAQRHRHRIPLMAQNSCYRMELAHRHPFIEGILYEDFPHTVCLMQDVSLAVSLQQKLYGYTQRPGSIMNSRFTSWNVSCYRWGLLCIAAAYQNNRRAHEVISRIVYPEILKQIGNAIFRIEDRDRNWINILGTFRELLLEMHERGLLRWKGHKWQRYRAYRRLICTKEEALADLVPMLSMIFH